MMYTHLKEYSGWRKVCWLFSIGQYNTGEYGVTLFGFEFFI